MNGKVFLFFMIIFLSVSILFFSITNSLSHNVFTPNNKIRNEMKFVLPQEWGFYSKNPRKLDLAYVEDGGESLNYPNARISNLWGLKRDARAEGTEAGLIFQEINNLYKMKETKMFFSDFKKEVQNEPYVKVKNKDTFKSMKGRYIVFTGDVIPFAWAKKTEDKFIVKKYIKVDIE